MECATVDQIVMASAAVFLHMFGVAPAACPGSSAGSCYGQWITRHRSWKNLPSRPVASLLPPGDRGPYTGPQKNRGAGGGGVGEGGGGGGKRWSARGGDEENGDEENRGGPVDAFADSGARGLVKRIRAGAPIDVVLRSSSTAGGANGRGGMRKGSFARDGGGLGGGDGGGDRSGVGNYDGAGQGRRSRRWQVPVEETIEETAGPHRRSRPSTGEP